jgi:transcription initiation factor TFIIIB Brf1 subunit/transcription initiation factor TFIIB
MSHPFDTPEKSPPAQDTEPGLGDSLQLIALGAIIAAIILSVTAMLQWLSPYTPAALHATVSLLLSVTVAYGYRGHKQIKTASIGLVVSLLAGLPVFAWTASPVRTAAIEYAYELLPSTSIVVAMNDDADDVRLATCRAVAVGERVDLRGDLVEALIDRPAELTRCIERVDQVEPKRAATLARRSLRQWKRALDAQSSSTVCRAAPALFSIDIQRRNHPARMLTDCAVRSEDKDVAHCCADALSDHFDSSEDYAAALGAPAALDPAERRRLFSPMTAHAFDHASAPRYELPELSRRLMAKPAMHRWLIALGCAGLWEENALEMYSEAMAMIAATRGCHVEPVGDRASLTAMWQGVCLNLGDTGASDLRMCQAVDDVVITQAIDLARVQVHAALQTRAANSLTQSIHRGDQRLHARTHGQGAEGRAFADSMKPSNLPPGLDSRFRRTLREASSASQRVQKVVQKLQNTSHEDDASSEIGWDDIKPYMSESQRNRLNEMRERPKQSAEKYNDRMLSDFDGVTK